MGEGEISRQRDKGGEKGRGEISRQIDKGTGR